MERAFLRGRFSRGAGRDAHGNAMSRDHGSWGDHGSGRYDGAGFHDCPVQDERADADEDTVVDGAAVQYGAVAYDHVSADGEGEAVAGDMEHAEVLNVGVGADGDVVHIAAGHGVEPEVGAVADFHIAKHNDAGREEDVLTEPWGDALV